jgi:CDP-glucose 4,6-dehydratase
VRFLVTGHTGFKGAWLTMLLTQRGHEVAGLALDPLDGSLYDRADVRREVRQDFRGDVRDLAAVFDALSASNPDVVIHMAAQPLVRTSLVQPRETVETNVIGTLNVLEAVRATEHVAALLVVTTDKVYANQQPARPRRVGDPLGGDDPYSASKAMADLMTTSWRTSFLGRRATTARAGNVIGGGDISQDRLLPDLLAAMSRGDAPMIRYPEAVRPWQHVLDALSGYLALVDAMLEGELDPDVASWNFGPAPAQTLTVGQVADTVASLWGAGARWQRDETPQPPETAELTLDASRSMRELRWRPVLDAEEALEWTVSWTRATNSGEKARAVTGRQLEEYEKRGGGRDPLA